MYELIHTSLASGRAVHFLIGVGGPQQLKMQPRSNALTNQFERVIAGCEIPLSSQSALRLREWIGASRPCASGTSLGDSTSAGAENSQSAQHVQTRPTLTHSYQHAQAKSIVTQPLLCSLSLCIPRIKYKSKKIEEELWLRSANHEE